mgnify:CR=1 FL=1
MDFLTGEMLLELCKKENISISRAMLDREKILAGASEETITKKLERVWEIMQHAAKTPVDTPKSSIGGLIGGQAKGIYENMQNGNNLCGPILSRAMAYACATLEVNASMGLIVAAPTAGSSGVIPGVLLAYQEVKQVPDSMIYRGLLNASAIGYLLMKSASVSGAEAGCQAEVGSASAMAASAIVELMGGNEEQCLNAASLAISNLLGLVCDPIAGLVESPCQTRNSIGAANALTAAEMTLAGVRFPIPFDEMAKAMLRVGKSLPFELRETALGGCAGTATGCSLGCDICGN